MIKKTINNANTEIVDLARYGSILLASVAMLFGAVEWFDSRYVDQDIFDVYRTQQEQEKQQAEQNLVQLFESMEQERAQDMVVIYRAIRDASITGLVIRRDTLLARGKSNLTAGEQAELEVLEAKLADIAATNPVPGR